MTTVDESTFLLSSHPPLFFLLRHTIPSTQTSSSIGPNHSARSHKPSSPDFHSTPSTSTIVHHSTWPKPPHPNLPVINLPPVPHIGAEVQMTPHLIRLKAKRNHRLLFLLRSRNLYPLDGRPNRKINRLLLEEENRMIMNEREVGEVRIGRAGLGR